MDNFITLARSLDSQEWHAVASLVERWATRYSARTIARTASKLARRYHVPRVPVPAGLTYDQTRQRYAAWKNAARTIGG